MKINNLVGLVVSLVLSVTCVEPASAQPTYSEENKKVSIEDGADLLNDVEKQYLLSQAEKVSEHSKFELRLVTTNDAEGMTTQEYAENYFESLTSGEPGIATGACYVIDMDNRQIYIATYGDLLYYLTDDRVDTLLDNAFEHISVKDYSGTLSRMLEDTWRNYQSGIQEGTLIVNTETESPETETETPSDGALVLKDGEYVTEVLGGKFLTLDDGQKALQVNVRFTNNSSEGIYALAAISIMAYQNDIEVEDITDINQDSSEGNSGNLTVSIRNGKSIEGSYTFALTDDSPVDVEFNVAGEIYSKTFTKE